MLRFIDSLLGSKLARRTLLLFVLCALIPVVVLSFLASQAVNELFQEQQKRDLHRAANSLGLLIYERFQYLQHDALRLHNNFLFGENKISSEQETSVFSKIIVSKGEGFNQFPDWLSERLLGVGHSTAKSHSFLLVDESTSDVWLAFLNGENTERIAFAISDDFLWGGLFDFDLSKLFRVYDVHGNLVFESNWDNGFNIDDLAEKQRASWSFVVTGLDGDNVWRIETYSLEKNNLIENENFQSLFRRVTLLAILLASFISIKVIRRSLQPVKALEAGIGRLNANNFDQPVVIRSGDEFELLGDTFNRMGEKLGRHIKAMETLSFIDQKILDRLKIEDVVDIAVNEGQHLLEAGAIYFLVHNMEDGCFKLFSSRGQLRDIALDSNTLCLLRKTDFLKDSKALAFSADLSALVDKEALFYTAIIEGREGVQAVLIAEFFLPVDDEVISMASMFVDHISIALNNADWEKRLYKQAYYDVLTGLPNRYLFKDHLELAISQAGKYGKKLALLFIDVDSFKSINDALGHGAGDQFLVEIAGRMSVELGDGKLFRLGGDEFAVIYNCAESQSNKVVQETGVMAEKLRSAVVKPFALHGKSLSYTVSIGIAIFPEDSVHADELLKFSDLAMYQAKREGKNGYYYYSTIYGSAFVEREKFVAELHQALANNEFELYYQPKINLSQCVIDGCEALIRWHHPRRGFLSAGEFISQVEAVGCIDDIGRWVLRHAVRQQRAWIQQGVEIGRLAINISVAQLLNKSFYNDVTAILREETCSGSALEFELTETDCAEDLQQFRDVLVALRDVGVIFSVDDYGTGYSSLSLLLKLPVDKVKIDKSFIDNVETDRISYLIVDSTIKLARAMGLSVIAEGVASPGQLALLAQSQCEVVQGFLFSKPVPAKDIATLVADKEWLLKFQ